jgi:hypothetical protein
VEPSGEGREAGRKAELLEKLPKAEPLKEERKAELLEKLPKAEPDLKDLAMAGQDPDSAGAAGPGESSGEAR